MAHVVAVHGIGHQYKGAQLIRQTWLPALRDGLARAGNPHPDEVDLTCAFYGHLFRPSGVKAPVHEPPYSAEDVTDALEQALLACWWARAAEVDDRVAGPDDPTKGRAPGTVQRALYALSGSRFFSGIAERALISDLRQVRSYFDDSTVRAGARRSVEQVMADDTRVIVGHSLGSVVAYEALCGNPDWPVRTLVTLGSPLGVRHLIFHRLDPPPSDGVGRWPGRVSRWVNVADRGDVVTLGRPLRPLFGVRVEDVLVHNGATAHDAIPYLTAAETGRVIGDGLAD